MAHENTVRDDQAPGPSDRSVGLLFSAVFLIAGLLPLLSSRSPRWWAVAIAAVLALIAVAVPRVLAPLNRLWMRLGAFLHRVISPVALGIMFFLAVVPTGLLMRAFGKDPLRLRRDPQAPTYWITRDPPGPRAESLRDQF